MVFPVEERGPRGLCRGSNGARGAGIKVWSEHLALELAGRRSRPA